MTPIYISASLKFAKILKTLHINNEILIFFNIGAKAFSENNVFVILIAWHLCDSMRLFEIILSLCFDKWKKCTTFANAKVAKIGCSRCKTLKQVLRFTRWHNLCTPEHRSVSFVRDFFLDKYMGKSYTASSLRILQGLTAAKVVGCSGAM